jgi:hypothetical protein
MMQVQVNHPMEASVALNESWRRPLMVDSGLPSQRFHHRHRRHDRGAQSTDQCHNILPIITPDDPAKVP